jgi:hypothetical protein
LGPEAACGSGWAEEGRRYRRAQRLGPTALVEAGGMAQRGRLEALRECMMSGVTVPPWRPRFYLARISNQTGQDSAAGCKPALLAPYESLGSLKAAGLRPARAVSSARDQLQPRRRMEGAHQ